MLKQKHFLSDRSRLMYMIEIIVLHLFVLDISTLMYI